ncbi:MAG: PKD domain-containing protein [Thermoplasmata archaeon]
MKYQPVAGFDHAGNDRTVQFTAAVMEGMQGDHYDIPAVAFHWNFGDGGTGTGMEVSHSYERKGRYDVILRVVWEDGSEQTFSRVVQVR